MLSVYGVIVGRIFRYKIPLAASIDYGGLRGKGLLVVASAGNAGPEKKRYTLGPPEISMFMVDFRTIIVLVLALVNPPMG